MTEPHDESEEKKSPIPGFKLLSKLGQGGMGSVFRARQLSLDREVALKVLTLNAKGSPDFKERFFREARSAGKLSHPNIVRGIDAGESGRYSWIAMELVEGESVAAKLERESRFREEEALSIIRQISEALQHASAAGIVHRDVKPENFLYTTDGIAKLCDLGIAKAPDDAGLTQDGKALGTPRYISPEQARGEHDVDSRSDIYSLGASWFHMLCGEPPFDGPTPAVVMMKHLTDDLPRMQALVPGINPHTVKVIEKMMAKSPDKRYQTFGELLQDLHSLVEGQVPSSFLPAGRSSRKTAEFRPVTQKSKTAEKGRAATKGRRETKALPWVLIGGVLAVLLVLFLLLSSDESDPASLPASTSGAPAPLPRVETPHKESAQSPKKVPAETPRKEPVATGSASREAQAEISWRTLKSEIPKLPSLLRVGRYRDFAKAFADTPLGKKAVEEADALEKELEESSRQMQELAARGEWEALENGRLSLTEQIDAVENIANSYPETSYAKKASARLLGLKKLKDREETQRRERKDEEERSEEGETEM